MPDMIEVQIDSVRVHLMTPSRLVVLKQINSERYLPIWVGPYEAEAITVALQEVEMVRPLTHDLLKNVFGAFNARITRIEIVKLENDIYYGTIVAEVDGREIYVDSRSSDAIALSVRAHVPILVHPSVMDSAGIVPEQDMPEGDEAPEKSEPAPLTKEGVERLTVFEDFLGKLDLDKLDDKDKPDEDEPPEKPKKPKKK
ncbi:MAG: bifunctional nuclease family protein [Anaerolineae bacterium]|nr:bifunctional nuclease family protein [Anaerolineae bacterium]MCI0607816.1 bifunctional nuclease family protein [Anaerolineae bacterium]